MGELSPIDLKGKPVKEGLVELQRGIVQTHACLEAHIVEQTKHNAAHLLAIDAAAQKREEVATGLAELRGEVRGILLALGVRKPEPGEEKPRGHAVATWGAGKVSAAIGGVATALVALVAAAATVWGALHANFPGAVPSPPIVAVDTVEAPE